MFQIKTIKQAAEDYEQYMDGVFPALPYTAKLSVEDVLNVQEIKAHLLKMFSEYTEVEEKALRISNEIKFIEAKYDKLMQRRSEIRNHVDVGCSYNDRLKRQIKITLLIDEIRGETADVLQKNMAVVVFSF